MTKKQRENAAKKAKEQGAKDLQNQEQEERLRQYRREQERAQWVASLFAVALTRCADSQRTCRRLAAQNAARARQRPKSQNFFGSDPAPASSGKVLSGGMTASLDPTSGSLVWE